MERPKPTIHLEPIDLILEAIGILGLVLLITLPLIYFNELPETIPRHFGVFGKPNGFSGKAFIWFLPTIGITTYLGLLWLNRRPDAFKYPQEVTDENAERLYKIATRTIRVLNAVVIVTFAYITYSIIHTAFEDQSGLGIMFVPLFLLLVFGIVGYMSYKLRQN